MHTMPPSSSQRRSASLVNWGGSHLEKTLPEAVAVGAVFDHLVRGGNFWKATDVFEAELQSRNYFPDNDDRSHTLNYGSGNNKGDLIHDASFPSIDSDSIVTWDPKRHAWVTLHPDGEEATTTTYCRSETDEVTCNTIEDDNDDGGGHDDDGEDGGSRTITTSCRGEPDDGTSFADENGDDRSGGNDNDGDDDGSRTYTTGDFLWNSFKHDDDQLIDHFSFGEQLCDAFDPLGGEEQQAYQEFLEGGPGSISHDSSLPRVLTVNIGTLDHSMLQQDRQDFEGQTKIWTNSTIGERLPRVSSGVESNEKEKSYFCCNHPEENQRVVRNDSLTDSFVSYITIEAYEEGFRERPDIRDDDDSSLDSDEEEDVELSNRDEKEPSFHYGLDENKHINSDASFVGDQGFERGLSFFASLTLPHKKSRSTLSSNIVGSTKQVPEIRTDASISENQGIEKKLSFLNSATLSRRKNPAIDHDSIIVTENDVCSAVESSSPRYQDASEGAVSIISHDRSSCVEHAGGNMVKLNCENSGDEFLPHIRSDASLLENQGIERGLSCLNNASLSNVKNRSIDNNCGVGAEVLDTVESPSSRKIYTVDGAVSNRSLDFFSRVENGKENLVNVPKKIDGEALVPESVDSPAPCWSPVIEGKYVVGFYTAPFAPCGACFTPFDSDLDADSIYEATTRISTKAFPKPSDEDIYDHGAQIEMVLERRQPKNNRRKKMFLVRRTQKKGQRNFRKDCNTPHEGREALTVNPKISTTLTTSQKQRKEIGSFLPSLPPPQDPSLRHLLQKTKSTTSLNKSQALCQPLKKHSSRIRRRWILNKINE